MNLRLALIQMVCEKGALEQNLASTLAYIEDAERHGTDIIAFPETSLSGYALPARYPHAVLALDSPTVLRVIESTRGKHLTALVGMVEATPTRLPCPP